MGLGFYMDVHVPVSITDGLRRNGVNVLTSQEDSTAEFDDESLLQRAADLERVLFSQDDDLLKIARAWQESAKSFCGLLFCHQLRTEIGRCVDDLTLVARCMELDEMRNTVMYLPLS